jgi:hypothetical protein
LRLVARKSRYLGHGVVPIAGAVLLGLITDETQHAADDVANDQLLWSRQDKFPANNLNAIEELVNSGPF